MGVLGKPFQFSIAPSMKYIEFNWTTSVWKFVNYLKATIHIEDEWESKPPRINDRCLIFWIFSIATTCIYSPRNEKD
jgi:hypothetical protein